MGQITSLIATMITGDLGRTVTRYKREGLMLAIMAVLGITAYICLIVAAVLQLSVTQGAIPALMIVTGISVVIMLILVAVMSAYRMRERRIAMQRRRNSTAAANLVIAAGMTLLRRQPVVATGGALALLALIAVLRKPDND